MKKYIEPDFEIIKFNQSDVITDSNYDNDGKDVDWQSIDDALSGSFSID